MMLYYSKKTYTKSPFCLTVLLRTCIMFLTLARDVGGGSPERVMSISVVISGKSYFGNYPRVIHIFLRLNLAKKMKRYYNDSVLS